MKVVQFNREQNGRYTVVYRGEPVDVAALIVKIQEPDRRLTAGRGAPGVFEFDGRALVCRQYIHGGWLRGITGMMFFGDKRASVELEITTYLEEKGFPVVTPFGFVVKEELVAKNLFFLSIFLENARDLIDHFRSAGQRGRLRMSKKLALLLFRMGRLGVYHPDLHLRNVLVSGEGELFFLDFDRAYRKEITPGDYEKMFWRLDRFVRKYSPLFGRPVDEMERLIFLRTYERLSGEKVLGINEGKTQEDGTFLEAGLVHR